MSQNIYDNPQFFAGYATLPRSVDGLAGAPEWERMQQLLPSLAGKNVLDLGCGYGWFCRWAATQQAGSVTGLDLSSKMLAKAITLTQDNNVVYQQADLETLPVVKEQFDLVYSSLTLHYVVNISSLISTVYQSIKPGGQFIFSAEHPIFTAAVHQGWCVDNEGYKSWPVNQYQAEGERITDWIAEGVIKQHRKLSSWINMLIQTGFEIVEMDEWEPTAAQVADNPLLEEEQERPMLFLLSVRKPL